MKLIAVALALSLIAAGAIAQDTLLSGQNLVAGQFLVNGPYQFIMQTDCNLVLYQGSTVLWSSQTNGQGSACTLILENNGNLVIISGSSEIWTSNSASGSSHYLLTVQSDGNVVIYGAPIWATNTAQNSKRRLL